MRSIRTSWWSLLVFALLGACAAETNEPAGVLELGDEGTAGAGAADGSDELGVQRASLGAIETLFSINGGQFLAMTSKFTLMRRDAGTACNPGATIWRLNHGDRSSFSTSDCSSQYRAGGGAPDGKAFVWRKNTREILRVDTSPPALVRVASGVDGVFGPILADSTHLYYADTIGIVRASRTPAPLLELARGSFTLLAIEGDRLFFEERKGTNEWKLWTVKTDDSEVAQPVVNLTGNNGFMDFALDGNNFYFVQLGTLRQIVAISRNTLLPRTVISSPSDTFRHPTPRPDATALYFVHHSVSGFGSIKIRKKVGSTFTDESPAGVYNILDMAATNSSLTWVEDTVTSKVVKRAPL